MASGARHADDHIHIVATLARVDGDRPDVWNDGYRIRDACRAVEARTEAEFFTRLQSDGVGQGGVMAHADAALHRSLQCPRLRGSPGRAEDC